jgi:hypothetical protein
MQATTRGANPMSLPPTVIVATSCAFVIDESCVAVTLEIVAPPHAACVKSPGKYNERAM